MTKLRRGAFAKRLLDVVGASAGLLLLSPIFLAIAMAVCLESPGGPFFRQERIGFQQRPFKIFKFRSMVDGAYGKGPAITASGDPRITRVGAFLRRHKLDELPQLFNVLSGSMSLVGPRPEVPQYFAHYSPEQRELVTSVKPGMTDFAAIELSNEEEILAGHEDKHGAYVDLLMPRNFELYRKYIEARSLWLDLTLIGKTIAAILRQH